MKILNFGSLNLDFVYSVDSFVRPGETKTSLSLEVHSGGKGLNQSIALARAGAQVYHAGCIGENGGALLGTLQRHGVDTRYIREEDCATGHAIIQVDDHGQNCILLHGGANQQISSEFVDRVLADFSKEDVVLLQNEINVTREIIDKAYAKGMRIALNPSPIDWRLRSFPLEKVHWLILNELEGADLTGEWDPSRIPDLLLERYPNLRVVLTLGKAGVSYLDGENRISHGIYDMPVVDTTAAGDVFTGYFLSGVLRGQPVAEALRMASVASSLSVGRRGASDSIPTLEEVEQAGLALRV